MVAGTAESLWTRPADLGEALRALRSGGWTVLAGGTDYYPARVGRAISEPLLDISSIASLRGVTRETRDGAPVLRVGALTTWSDLLSEPRPDWMRALVLSARELGGIQIQNRATIGGNLCNASPAADGVPALLALDAEVELASVAGVRTMPLAQFVLGNRRTARRADELLTAVLLPEPDAARRSVFLKLGHRRYLVISIVMVGLALEADAQGRVSHCAIAVGSCTAAALRLDALEGRVLGSPLGELATNAAALVDAAALAPLSPIDDVRGSAHYRRVAAASLVARGLRELAAECAR